jgi:hypothetical protein
MIGLSGSLRVAGFRPLAGFLAGLGTRGTLRITADRWVAEVSFEPGSVTGATLGAETGLAALEGIALGMREGEFTFTVDSDGGAVPAERTLDLSTPDLLAHLDALLEQWGGGPDAVRTPAAVPFVVREDQAPAGKRSGQVTLPRTALHTLLAVDGRRSVDEIAAARGLAETIKDLQLLQRHSLVGVAAAPQPAAPPEHPLPPARPTPPPGGRSVPLEPLSNGTPAAPPVAHAPAPSGPPRAGVPAVPVPAAATNGPVGGAVSRWGLVCPLLGFAGDRVSHFPRPTQEHRCYAGREPRRIDAADQHDLCLDPTGAHAACARFRAGAGAPGAVPASVGPRGPA